MSRLRLDQAAIALSGLCMIHCVASVHLIYMPDMSFSSKITAA